MASKTERVDDVIQNEFHHIKVYGKEFTEHHKDQIAEACRKLIERFANWLHFRGYVRYPHKSFEPRKWMKGDRLYSENELYHKFIYDKKYHN